MTSKRGAHRAASGADRTPAMTKAERLAEDFEERAALVADGNPHLSRSEADALAWEMVYGPKKGVRRAGHDPTVTVAKDSGSHL